jgi:hypothetical protein
VVDALVRAAEEAGAEVLCGKEAQEISPLASLGRNDRKKFDRNDRKKFGRNDKTMIGQQNKAVCSVCMPHIPCTAL